MSIDILMRIEKEKQHVSSLNLLSVVCRKEDKLKMQWVIELCWNIKLWEFLDQDVHVDGAESYKYEQRTRCFTTRTRRLFYKDCSLGWVRNPSDNQSLVSYWCVNNYKITGIICIHNYRHERVRSTGRAVTMVHSVLTYSIAEPSEEAQGWLRDYYYFFFKGRRFF